MLDSISNDLFSFLFENNIAASPQHLLQIDGKKWTGIILLRQRRPEGGFLTLLSFLLQQCLRFPLAHIL